MGKGGGAMTELEFQQYAAYVGKNFGIQLPPEKKTLLESRLYKLLTERTEPEFADAASFFHYLEQDKSGEARRLLANAITTNHTFFMRETDHFEYFRDAVLPYWAEHISDGDLRTWCAASSTGEEPYTLAMIQQDFFSLRGGAWDKTLLATDLSEQVLAKAREGLYEASAITSMPSHWQGAYFRPAGNGQVQVTEAIRQQVLYRRFNLMEPVFPFRRPFHTIFCRNVMIYFAGPTRQRLARKFYDFLEPGGFLFIGHSEVIDRQAAPFSYVMPSVYRRM